MEIKFNDHDTKVLKEIMEMENRSADEVLSDALRMYVENM